MTRAFDTTPERMAVRDILAAVGREATALGHVADGAQDRMSRLARASGLDEGAMQDLQSLDLFSQSLFGLADFLSDLAADIPAEWDADAVAAARNVRLSDLARRLSRPDRERGRPPIRDDAGALELFESGVA